MRNSDTLDEQVWTTTENLNTGASRIISVLGLATFQASANCVTRPYLRFGLYADRVLTLDIMVSMDNATFRVDQTLLTTAGKWFHVYDLQSPRNQSGFFVLGSNFVQMRLSNASGINTATLEFLAAIRNKA